MTIFEDFTIAISQPSRYGELLKRKKILYTAFVFILVLLTSLANVVYPSVNMLRTAREYYDFKVPDFKIEDGTLFAKDDFSFDFSPFLLKMDDTKEFTSKDASGYQTAILLGKEKILLKSSTGVVSFEYKEAGNDFKFTKNDVYNYKDMIIISVVITDIILFLFSFAIFFLGAFFVQMLTRSFLKMLKLKISREEHFKLCVYSRAMPSLLSAVLVLLGFGFLYIASLMVSVVYIYRVFINMKENQQLHTEE